LRVIVYILVNLLVVIVIGDSPIYLFSEKILDINEETGLFYFYNKKINTPRVFIYDPILKKTFEN